MISDILDDIKSRKNFYRDNMRRVAFALFLSSIIILILIVAILFRFFTWTQSDYYATSAAGQLTQLLSVQKGTALIDPPNA